MISKKGLIILISVILVIAIGGYFVIMYNPDKVEKKNEIPKMPTVEVYEKDVNTLKEINIKLPNEEYTLSFENGVFVNKSDTKLDTLLISQMASDISVMTAREVIEENATDLDKYSFSNPKSVVTAVFEDETKVIKIGEQTSGNAYFMHIEGQNTVYAIYSTKGDMFVKTFDELKDFNVLTVSDTSLLKAEIKDGEKQVSFDKRDNRWYVTPPNRQVNETVLGEKVFSYIGYIKADEFITDEDLEKYGLKTPQKSIRLKDGKGIDQTFYFGNEEEGYVYVKLSDSKEIFKADSVVLELFNVVPTDFVDTFVIDPLPNIKNVKKITLVTSDKNLSISRTESGGKVSFSLNGNSISEDKYKELYTSVISSSVTEFKNIAYENKPYCKISFEFNDSSKKTYEYALVSDRQLAVYENQKSIGYVSKQTIDTIINSLK
ncbi:MAG: DUF4340 domain-containing protein [Ruminococcaceae bacterium]|nr:DUF4340 domain-containing protein [Oscillospiraceae bacterium]